MPNGRPFAGRPFCLRALAQALVRGFVAGRCRRAPWGIGAPVVGGVAAGFFCRALSARADESIVAGARSGATVSLPREEKAPQKRPQRRSPPEWQKLTDVSCPYGGESANRPHSFRDNRHSVGQKAELFKATANIDLVLPFRAAHALQRGVWRLSRPRVREPLPPGPRASRGGL